MDRGLGRAADRRVIDPLDDPVLAVKRHHARAVVVDLVRLDAGSAQTLMRNVDKDKLAVALKGASETVREFFLKAMSSRAAKMLVDDMQALGPVRLRDVDEAQSLLVNKAKDMAAKGEILISKSRGDDELVY